MALKYTSSPDSAYEVAIGATEEDARKANLAVVEMNYATTPPTPVYGRYKDAPKGAGLGITIDKPGDTQVIGGGSVFSTGPGAAQKGDAVNINDPIVHNATDADIHADGSVPPVRDLAAEQAAADEAAAATQNAK